MAIDESTGYSGDTSPGPEWARAQWFLGSRYGVYHQDDLRITKDPAGTRQVKISSGYFGGWGVTDHNDDDVLMTFPISLAGTRYDLIVARRDWSTGTTSFQRINGGATPTLPPIGADGPRYANPGVIDDQPIAYVGIAVGQTQPSEIIDMRCMGTGKESFIIRDERAMQYLGYLGTRVRLGTTEWVRTLNDLGNPVWLRIPGPWGKVSLPVDTGIGGSEDEWTSAGLGSYAIQNGNDVDFTLHIRKWRNGNLPVSATGHVGDLHIFTLDQQYWPGRVKRQACTYINQDGSNSIGFTSLSADGKLSFTAGTPGRSLKMMPEGSWSLAVTYKYTQES